MNIDKKRTGKSPASNREFREIKAPSPTPPPSIPKQVFSSISPRNHFPSPSKPVLNSLQIAQGKMLLKQAQKNIIGRDGKRLPTIFNRSPSVQRGSNKNLGYTQRKSLVKKTVNS